jgi:biotin operon repressor
MNTRGLPAQVIIGGCMMTRGKFLALVDRGYSETDIAKMFGVSRQAVNQHFNRLGINFSEIKPKLAKPISKRALSNQEKMGLYKRGLNDCEISRELGISTTAVSQWRYRNQLPANAKVGWQGRH